VVLLANGICRQMTDQKNSSPYTDSEIEQRAFDALRRALNTPYKPQRDLVGTTDRAKAQALKRKAKNSPKEK